VRVQRGAPLSEALPLAVRAAQLEPGEIEHSLAALRLAARGGEVQEARARAEELLARSEGEDRRKIEDLLRELSEPRSKAGGLYFDPQGADFGLWIDAFKDEVYRNWVVPKAVASGEFRGHVDLEFTVERDGSLSALRVLKSSGKDECDRAARQALEASKFAVLPLDYKPPRVTVQVTFFYNESPTPAAK
jgi:TonB family protein